MTNEGTSKLIDGPQCPVFARNDLPRVELTSFDGNSVDYWKFVRQFECYVESKTNDPGQRLLYLLYYCRGSARKAIDACVILPPAEGYQRARTILKDMFGLPHVVARSLLNELLCEAKQVRNTSDSLSSLALSMENCQISLKQMQCEADLNSIATLEGIVQCLPVAMQHQWADVADVIVTDGGEVTFDQLMEFVARRARISRSRFGQLLEKPTNQSTRANPATRSELHHSDKRHVYLTTRDPAECNVACCLCKTMHKLSSCPRFLESDVKTRWEIAKRNSVCFVCLRRYHSAAACKTKTWCTAAECGRRHHSLLHYDGMARTPHATINCSHTTFNDKVCLGSIPVKIETPDGLVTAVALLDNGSDTTLIRKEFVERHGMAGTQAEVSISTLGRQWEMQCTRLSFNIHSIDGTEVIHVPQAYTVEKLPRVSRCSSKAICERHEHLRGLDFMDVNDSVVTVLIGCNIPEAHWALEQRLGGAKRPFATRTLLGWVLQGPTDVSNTMLSVHYIAKNEDSTPECFERLYNTDCGDLSNSCKRRSRDDGEAQYIVDCARLADAHFQVPLSWKPDGRKPFNNADNVVVNDTHMKLTLVSDVGVCKADDRVVCDDWTGCNGAGMIPVGVDAYVDGGASENWVSLDEGHLAGVEPVMCVGESRLISPATHVPLPVPPCPVDLVPLVDVEVDGVALVSDECSNAEPRERDLKVGLNSRTKELNVLSRLVCVRDSELMDMRNLLDRKETVLQSLNQENAVLRGHVSEVERELAEMRDALEAKCAKGDALAAGVSVVDSVGENVVEELSTMSSGEEALVCADGQSGALRSEHAAVQTDLDCSCRLEWKLFGVRRAHSELLRMSKHASGSISERVDIGDVVQFANESIRMIRVDRLSCTSPEGCVGGCAKQNVFTVESVPCDCRAMVTGSSSGLAQSAHVVESSVSLPVTAMSSRICRIPVLYVCTQSSDVTDKGVLSTSVPVVDALVVGERNLVVDQVAPVDDVELSGVQYVGTSDLLSVANISRGVHTMLPVESDSGRAS